ncbi:DUF2867 domain-containing protein [Hymenobacter cellulosilyticus]|uniref:DUF2867 domain-containing protein n=1 Tax=Hymenobacter cellulosilyticus TaxID=2932248 RepID=UPI0028809999|nr:DUF2867 domain-containing protein [Hymenobacter cellulosilyticus]
MVAVSGDAHHVFPGPEPGGKPAQRHDCLAQAQHYPGAAPPVHELPGRPGPGLQPHRAERGNQQLERRGEQRGYREKLHGLCPDSAARHAHRPAGPAFYPAPEEVLQNIWSIGGERGWYKVDWLWRVRGFMDKAVGGVGLRRGRRSPSSLHPGDPLDFWRVLVADRAGRRLLLYAEMKLPGEAWLQFRILDNADGSHTLEQLAAFRPQGLAGRLYWYSLVPFHFVIFKGMVENIVQYGKAPATAAEQSA